MIQLNNLHKFECFRGWHLEVKTTVLISLNVLIVAGGLEITETILRVKVALAVEITEAILVLRLKAALAVEKTLQTILRLRLRVALAAEKTDTKLREAGRVESKGTKVQQQT